MTDRCRCCGQTLPTNEQVSLDSLVLSPRFRAGDPSTSSEAAELAPTRIHLANDFGQILVTFWEAQPMPLSAEDVEAAGGRSRHRRVSELVASGYLIATGETTRGRWGREIQLYGLTLRGEALGEALSQQAALQRELER
jgi:hypothetical protein